jgi:glycosyltransferase involved in cell wall biosynthesis
MLAGDGISPGAVCDTPASHVDVYPFVFECVGAPVPADDGHPGISLTRLADGAVPDRGVVSEYHAISAVAGSYMLRDGPYKYMHYVAYRPQLYDLARDPEVVYILGRIQEIAREMRRCLEDAEIDRFAALMREHWELNKRLDPNSSNRHVEAVLGAAAPYASGFKMVGAGGGGFAEIVARGEREAERIARAVSQAGGRVYPWQLAE